MSFFLQKTGGSPFNAFLEDVREARSKCKPTEHSFPRVVLKLFDDAQLGAVGVGPGYGAPLLRVLF